MQSRLASLAAMKKYGDGAQYVGLKREVSWSRKD